MSQRMNYNAISPAGTKALGSVYGYVRQSGLPTRLIDLVYLRVSQINGCAYCIDSHSRDLLKGGLPVEHLVLVAIWPEAGAIFSETEKAALAWAEAVTSLGLTIAISLMNAYNRMAISFRATPLAVAQATPAANTVSQRITSAA
jgi:AhpD family alkylhydroperoxidase